MLIANESASLTIRKLFSFISRHFMLVFLFT